MIYKAPAPTKAERARALRYKRPALASLGYAFIPNELDEIREACSDIHWFMDNDDETLLNALDGDEEAEYEFRVAFSELESKAEQLNDVLCDHDIGDYFDDCTVALIGNRYKVVGYDSVEEDYYSLASYDSEIAYTESGKRLMRRTKADMLSIIGQCMGITLAVIDLRQSYDYLRATMDILRDKNTSLLQVIREIDDAYEAAYEAGFEYAWQDECKRFDALLSRIPDRTWLE